MTESTNVRPCPFCHKPPRVRGVTGVKDGRRRVVACENPACPVIPTVTGSSRADAVRKWNGEKPPLKVYGWLGYRSGAGQTREIMAAPSKAAVKRITGFTDADLFNFSKTGNEDEIATAEAVPGVVFWKPIDAHRRGGGWTRG